MDSTNSPKLARSVYVGILVAALGYFVDVYDLILFSVVRVASLKALGVAEDALLSAGVFLLNVQMAGMLLGGILWGIWGDKKGRISVLFGSIFLYSFANIANGFVDSIEAYAVCRFLAGLGLAGELGAGITLVTESMPKEIRGYGTTIVATVGVAGAVVAGLVGDIFDWRISYFIGGGLGFLLLILRIAVHESGLFEEMCKSSVRKGDLLLLLRSKTRFVRYLECILIGLPIWYVVGILITFCPEIGTALGMTEAPATGKAVLYCYIGLVLGDLCSGLVSQALKSRKKAIGLFILLTAVFSEMFLSLNGATPDRLYLMAIPLGFAVGYWAVFVTSAAEQFGTNLRATVATSAPNFVRGAVIPMTMMFEFLKTPLGITQSAFVVGVFVIFVSLVSLIGLEETFSKDLDYFEE